MKVFYSQVAQLCPGPVYFVCPSQNLRWEPDVLAPTHYFVLDLCNAFALLKTFVGSQRF